ncbi:MAG: hypothetical protein AAF620_14930, partial [Bacteroidota bacterium]
AGDSLYLDSLSTDTTFVEVQELRDSVKYETVQELHIKNTFHNDRTHHEVDAVKEYIVDRGINASRIQIRTQVNKQNVWRREELEDDTEHNKTHEIRSIGLRVLKM